MGRVADPKLASLWRERVEHQQRSGMSIAEYCRREGFSTGSFYAWKRRLRTSRTAVGKKRRRDPQQVAVGRGRRGGFVQVPLAVESAIEVRFADGTVVSVPTEHLAMTLKLLKASQLESATDD